MSDSTLVASAPTFAVSFTAVAATKLPTRLSRPEPGRSLGATVTRAERPIRQAIRLLSRAVAVDAEAFAFICACTPYGPEGVREPDDVRLAWFLVNTVLTHAFVTDRTAPAPFSQSMEWFLGDACVTHKLLSCFPKQQLRDAESELRALCVSEDLLDLLPYILEPHGHITRNSLETCEIARRTRAVKKFSGVYYTPSDVAEFMVEALSSKAKVRGTWLDPACGTGVFLRAILKHRHCDAASTDGTGLFEFALTNVFGIDKSALATDLAAFVLLIECALQRPLPHPPLDSWRQLKRNIVCMDALRLIPRMNAFSLHGDTMQLVRIRDVFPSVGNAGFDHVVMNPPYAVTPLDERLQAVWHSFSDAKPGQTADTHLAFTEMLWRLTSEHGAAAAVLPISIGTNTTRSYTRLRNELLRSNGTKEFLFFDREPQALFGEDIKTRNLILFRHHVPFEKSVRTSRLLKWTGEQRPAIFTRGRLVDVDVSRCKAFVPKIGTAPERAVYTQLTSNVTLMRAIPFTPRIFRMSLDDARADHDLISERTVLVSSTAYNFINCFFSDGLPKNTPRPYSNSPINALAFSSEDEALAAFALVSSRLCFWLWHVEGDGFHLTSDFLKRLPLWAVFESRQAKARLAQYGQVLWTSSKNSMAGSVNGGKQTYSFHCGHDHPLAKEVESLLAKELSLGKHISLVLDGFIQATVSIDGKRRDRRFDSESI